ncbi:hypothetical protein KCP73_01970 [Salmonella enterica subsp. enterica]|nr:hypothetical protein KCP73_01970 [Salmonella enterica subsp. enterica]
MCLYDSILCEALSPPYAGDCLSSLQCFTLRTPFRFHGPLAGAIIRLASHL